MMYANRLKTKVLPEERDGVQQHLRKYIKLNAMYNTEQQMENIMNTPSVTPDEKSALYSKQYQRFRHFRINVSIKFKIVLKNVTKGIEESSKRRFSPNGILIRLMRGTVIQKM